MALDNKYPAGGSFGDADPTVRSEPDNAADRAHDGAGIPQTAGWNNNKFQVGGVFGDSDYAGIDNPNDFAQDSAGVVNPDMGEKADMDLNLAGNKFPRETGHDSLTEEEAQLT